jgi:hypothetical protein
MAAKFKKAEVPKESKAIELQGSNQSTVIETLKPTEVSHNKQGKN